MDLKLDKLILSSKSTENSKVLLGGGKKYTLLLKSTHVKIFEIIWN